MFARSRRDALKRCGTGMGMLALGTMLADQSQGNEIDTNPLAPKKPHFEPEYRLVQSSYRKQKNPEKCLHRN